MHDPLSGYAYDQHIKNPSGDCAYNPLLSNTGYLLKCTFDSKIAGVRFCIKVKSSCQI